MHEPRGEKTFGMVVIARFPRLDPSVSAAATADTGVTGTPVAIAPAGVTMPGPPKASVGSFLPGRRRGPRVRFPAVSTLVLAVIAGVFWMAVWREEQRRAAEDADGNREALAMEPDGDGGVIR